MLERVDIVGHAIRRVRQRVRRREIGDRFDVGHTWFTLDSGVSFSLRSAGAGLGLAAEDVPAEARELTADKLLGRRIVEVWRALGGGHPAGSESAVLELESGLLLVESNVAPHGTDGVGLYAFDRIEWARLDTPLEPWWAPSV